MGFKDIEDFRGRGQELHSRVNDLFVERDALNGDKSWIHLVADEHTRALSEECLDRSGLEVYVSMVRPEIYERTYLEPRRNVVVRILTKELFKNLKSRGDTESDGRTFWIVDDVTVFDNGISQYGNFAVDSHLTENSLVPVFRFREDGVPFSVGARTRVIQYCGIDEETVYPFGNYDKQSSPFALGMAHKLLDECADFVTANVPNHSHRSS